VLGPLLKHSMVDSDVINHSPDHTLGKYAFAGRPLAKPMRPMPMSSVVRPSLSAPMIRMSGAVVDPPMQDTAEEAVTPDAPEAAATESEDKKKATKTPIEDLKVGDEIEGKIRSVLTYGAFVDIGASTDALLHVSEISNEFVEDATEKLTKGEVVKGRIKAINLEKKQIAMTCKEPRAPRESRPARKKVDLSQYESADPKEFVTGKVNSITDFGAFVTLEGGADGLVHISQIQEGGVGKVSDVLEVGKEVQVRITKVDKAKGQMGLSMLPWVEGGDEKPRRGGGGGSDFSMFEAEKLTPEELEKLSYGDEITETSFGAAFDIMAKRQQAKSKGERFYKNEVR